MSVVNKDCYTDSDKPEICFQYGPEHGCDLRIYPKPAPSNIGSGMDGLYYNLWSAENATTTVNDDPVIKTVYDPSPVGYCVPPSGAFTGFLYNGTAIINNNGIGYGTQINSPCQSSAEYSADKGFYFYCNKMNGRAFSIPTGGRSFSRRPVYARQAVV